MARPWTRRTMPTGGLSGFGSAGANAGRGVCGQQPNKQLTGSEAEKLPTRPTSTQRQPQWAAGCIASRVSCRTGIRHNPKITRQRVAARGAVLRKSPARA